MGTISLSGEDSGIEEIIEEVKAALGKLRIHPVMEEYALQESIARCLDAADIPFEKEYKLGPRNRIDFFIPGGIGIEVKKGKPNRTQVIRQLERYTALDTIQGVILVVERNVTLPDTVGGKPCISFGLNRLWGVALK